MAVVRMSEAMLNEMYAAAREVGVRVVQVDCPCGESFRRIISPNPVTRDPQSAEHYRWLGKCFEDAVKWGREHATHGEPTV